MIDFNIPTNTPNTKKYVLDVIQGKSYGEFGKYYNLCKEFLEDYTKAKKIILTHSATSALEMSFQLLNSKKHTALMPSYTFSSTANAVLKNGMKISWIDVSEEDLCANVNEFNESNIKNKIFVPVHYGSSSCNLSSVSKNSIIIEDAAQSLGVFHNQKHVGTFGLFGVLSFHNTKFIQSGFGGAILINDVEFFDNAMELYNRGTNRHLFLQNKVNKYNWTALGSSYGNSDINFALLFSQLENLDQIISKREKIYKTYLKEFSNLIEYGIKFQDLKNVTKSNYSTFYLLVNDLTERNKLISFLKENGITGQFHYVNLHDSPMGKKFTKSKRLKVSESITHRVVRLPLYPDLKKWEIEKIITTVKNFFQINYENIS